MELHSEFRAVSMAIAPQNVLGAKTFYVSSPINCCWSSPAQPFLVSGAVRA
jgi:hypothetical protein